MLGLRVCFLYRVIINASSADGDKKQKHRGAWLGRIKGNQSKSMFNPLLLEKSSSASESSRLSPEKTPLWSSLCRLLFPKLMHLIITITTRGGSGGTSGSCLQNYTHVITTCGNCWHRTSGLAWLDSQVIHIWFFKVQFIVTAECSSTQQHLINALSKRFRSAAFGVKEKILTILQKVILRFELMSSK